METSYMQDLIYVLQSLQPFQDQLVALRGCKDPSSLGETRAALLEDPRIKMVF